jgi:hypothetical protein
MQVCSEGLHEADMQDARSLLQVNLVQLQQCHFNARNPWAMLAVGQSARCRVWRMVEMHDHPIWPLCEELWSAERTTLHNARPTDFDSQVLISISIIHIFYDVTFVLGIW